MNEIPLDRLDFLDVSVGSYEAGEWIVHPGEWESGVLAPFAQRCRRHCGLPVGVAGRINSARAAARIVASGQADFVSLARTLHADPAFPQRVLSGAAYRPCIVCNRCIDELHDNQPIGCSVNARAGREEARNTRRRTAPARVLVIGGGPAGMETARLLAEDGHAAPAYPATVNFPRAAARISCRARSASCDRCMSGEADVPM
ncbi:hypothetical protein [Streptomyces sp. NPDC096324]|uniref:oxidoreductase n=1 Tax=Streptomyces sp. NPDC096324 TaxID=3366085 RepID=UPI00380742F4